MSTNRHHAYKDYHGPRLPGTKRTRKDDSLHRDDDDGGEEENPLGALSWMGGDSLAPPCGTSVPLIHGMLDFASVNRDDVLYDLGCGDARVLLEAVVKKSCRQCVGVELEEELVERSNELIESLPLAYREDISPQYGVTSSKRIQIVHGDLRLLLKEFVFRVENAVSGDPSTLRTERPYQTLPMPTIITLYLLPEGIAEIEEDLIKLLPHMRIICFSWGLKTIRPIEEKELYDQKTLAATSLFLYNKECFERLKGFEYMLKVYHHGH